MTRRDFIISLFGTAALLSLDKIKLLSKSQIVEDTNTAKIFSKIISRASKQKWYSMDINDLISRIAVEFVGTSYVGGTLDRNPEKEEVVINLEELDCVTFMENSLCIARCIKKQHFRFNDLIDEILYTRYRDGKLNDYTSRLHYTTDWIDNNIKKGVIDDITESLGGVKHKFELNFMSSHSNFYPALNSHKEYISKIKEIENKLNKKTVFIIKKADIKSISKKLKDGDIIAIATSAEGLDYSHVGLMFNGKLLHASSNKKKVVIDKPLYNYLSGNKKAIGITVLRPKII